MVATDAEILRTIRELCDTTRPEHFANPNHCCECAEHDELLCSRDLDTLTVDDVGNPGWDPICMVTAHAFFYYFPALARLALEPPSSGHGWYFEQLLFHLTYEGSANRRRLAADLRHKQAVLMLLEYVRDTRASLVDEFSCQKDLESALSIWKK